MSPRSLSLSPPPLKQPCDGTVHAPCGVCVALNLRSGEDRLRLLVRLESGKPEDLPCGRFLVGIPPALLVGSVALSHLRRASWLLCFSGRTTGVFPDSLTVRVLSLIHI